MADEEFQQTFECKIKGRTIKKFRSNSTGLTITHIDTEGPIVKGNFTLATEETGNDGLPHTLEHLIFLGSELYPYKGILDLAANQCLAQGTNAWTATDHTCYTIETAGNQGFLILLPIYLDHIFFPTLSDEAFKTEVHHVNGTGDDAGVVYCEMQARENKDWSREDHANRAAIFTNDCGYKWETGGLMKNLRESCSNQKVKEYHKLFYRPENANIIISGQIDIKQIFNAILPVNERIAKVDYGPYIKPWSTDVELFTSSATEDILFPAKDADNGSISITWKGPLLDDTKMCEAHSYLWNYMTTSASPLVKALIDIPEPYCSSVSYYSTEHPSTTMHVYCSGVKPNKHQAIKEIIMKTLQETLESCVDMVRLKIQIKNSIHNFSDRLENNPAGTLTSVVIQDQLYGGESHSCLTSFCSIFEFIDELLEENENFWKDLIGHYIHEPNITINSIPSTQCMTDLETAEKQRITEQQQRLGEDGMAKCAKEISDCIAFNERNAEEVQKFINALPIPAIGDNISYHSVHAHLKETPGIFVHEIESEFCRFFFTFDTEKLAMESKIMLLLYNYLFDDTALLYDGQEFAYEDAIKLTERLLLNASESSFGYGQLVTMEFKFVMDDLKDCIQLISDLIVNKIFTHDRVSTAVNKILSRIDISFRNAQSVLDEIDVSTRFYGSCGSCMNDFSVRSFLNSYKDDVSGLIKKLENLQHELVYGNNVSLHIVANKTNVARYFSSEELSKLGSIYHLSKANYPTRLPSFYKRKFSGIQRLLKTVPTDESSYFSVTHPTIISYDHPDHAAVILFAEYIGQSEGTLWKQIRGQGFAYSYGLYNSIYTGSICFYLSKATNVCKGYLAAKDAIKKILEENKLDETQIKTAKGVLTYGLIDIYETPYSSAFCNINNLIMGRSLDYNTNLLSRIENTNQEDLLNACKRYIQPLFTDSANVIVCCPSTKKDEVCSDLSGIGLNFNIIEDVEEYIKFLDGNEIASEESVYKSFVV